MRSRHGFCLVELLVVLTVITVLASVLTPALCSARGKARQASCLSNERQLATALLAYAQDYDETLPAWGRTGRPPPDIPYMTWWCEVYPYVANGPVFVCPSNDNGGGRGFYHGSPWVERQYKPSYGMNPGIHEGNEGRGVRLGEIAHASEVLLLADSCHPMGQDWRFAWPRARAVLGGSPNGCTIRPGEANAAQQSEATVHNGGSNVAFCDGHVKWLAAEIIWADRTNLLDYTR